MPRRDEYDDDRQDDNYDDHADDRRDDQDRDDYDDQPKKGGREWAARKVTLPAIFLMIVGGLGVAIGVLRLIVYLVIGVPNPHPMINHNDIG